MSVRLLARCDERLDFGSGSQRGWASDSQKPFNQRVRELYEAGKSTLVVARLLGCSDELIRQRLIGMGIERRKRGSRSLLDYHPSCFCRGRTYPVDDLEAFNRMLLYFYCLGFRQSEIASMLGVHRGTVQRRVQALRQAYVFKIRQCRRCDAIYRTIKPNSRICPRCTKPTRKPAGNSASWTDRQMMGVSTEV